MCQNLKKIFTSKLESQPFSHHCTVELKVQLKWCVSKREHDMSVLLISYTARCRNPWIRDILVQLNDIALIEPPIGPIKSGLNSELV